VADNDRATAWRPSSWQASCRRAARFSLPTGGVAAGRSLPESVDVERPLRPW